MDESIGTLAQLSSKFARRLEGRFGRPAYLIDERLSSVAAKALTGSERIDDVAAALILESWLETARVDSLYLLDEVARQNPLGFWLSREQRP